MLDDSRQAPDVFPLTRKAVGKGDGNWEGSNVSSRRIDGEAVGSTALFRWTATTSHVTSGTVQVLDGTGDQVITALELR